MVTLTEFLTARLDEDEALARAVRSYPGVADPGIGEPPTWWAFIKKQTPPRALAEVEAKRRIVETYAVHYADPQSSDAGFHNCGDSCVYEAMDWTLKILALPYAAHEDYDEAWRV